MYCWFVFGEARTMRSLGLTPHVSFSPALEPPFSYGISGFDIGDLVE
jgi:hypothetical protein